MVDAALKQMGKDITLTEVLINSKNISAKLDDINRVTAGMKDEFVNDSKAMKEAVEKVSKIVASLVEHLNESKAHPEASVRPKEKKEKEVEHDNAEEPVPLVYYVMSRKYQTISIAKSEWKKTYHIEKHEGAKDPDMFLRKNLDTLDEYKYVNFILISVGSNGITELNIEEDIRDLNNIACEQSKNLVHLAEEASIIHNIDAFIVEKPTRFDKKKSQRS